MGVRFISENALRTYFGTDVHIILSRIVRNTTNPDHNSLIIENINS